MLRTILVLMLTVVAASPAAAQTFKTDDYDLKLSVVADGLGGHGLDALFHARNINDKFGVGQNRPELCEDRFASSEWNSDYDEIAAVESRIDACLNLRARSEVSQHGVALNIRLNDDKLNTSSGPKLNERSSDEAGTNNSEAFHVIRPSGCFFHFCDDIIDAEAVFFEDG